MANKSREEEVQDAKEAAMNKTIADAIEKGIATGLAAVGQILKPPAPATVTAPLPPEFSPSDRCTKCLQFRNVCRDRHVLMVVAPANPRRYTRFPGMTLGGVTYISPRPGARIYVPEKNDLAYQIQRYEDEEDNLKEGNVINHNSGTLSPHASNQSISQANPMGFRGMNQGAPN